MIEMLGVLAIIGVLSAGGVWGYNLAMDNHNTNQAIDDIQTTVANLTAVFLTKTSGSRGDTKILWPDDLKKLNLIANKGKKYWGKELDYRFHDRNDRKYLLVQIHSPSKSACVKIATHKWLRNVPYYFIEFYASSKWLGHIWNDGKLGSQAMETVKNLCKTTNLIYLALYIQGKYESS